MALAFTVHLLLIMCSHYLKFVLIIIQCMGIGSEGMVGAKVRSDDLLFLTCGQMLQCFPILKKLLKLHFHLVHCSPNSITLQARLPPDVVGSAGSQSDCGARYVCNTSEFVFLGLRATTLIA